MIKFGANIMESGACRLGERIFKHALERVSKFLSGKCASQFVGDLRQRNCVSLEFCANIMQSEAGIVRNECSTRLNGQALKPTRNPGCSTLNAAYVNNIRLRPALLHLIPYSICAICPSFVNFSLLLYKY